jgi:hypothetical protein
MAEFPASHKVTGLPTCGMTGRRDAARNCVARFRANAKT